MRHEAHFKNRTYLLSSASPRRARLRPGRAIRSGPARSQIRTRLYTSDDDETRLGKPTKLTEEQRALHALNRLTFGPRPGDLQKVMDTDVNDWIEQQLHPEEINDSVLDGKLGPLRTLRMSTRDLLQTFPNNKTGQGSGRGKDSSAGGSSETVDLRGTNQHPDRTPEA